VQKSVQIRANGAAGAKDTPAAPDQSAEPSPSKMPDSAAAVRGFRASNWLRGGIDHWLRGWGGSLVIFLGG